MKRHGLEITLALLVACGGGSGDDDGDDDDVPVVDAGPDATPADASFLQPNDRDIVSTELALNLTTREATATIAVAGATGPGAKFEVGDLEILDVRSGGAPVAWAATSGNLVVAAGPDPITLVVSYRFASHENFQGWDATPGFTLLWPYFCGNLFPCDSFPVDGTSFTMTVTGVPMGQTAVFPAAIPGEAPSYMPAVTVGAYTYEKLGDTAAGTEVGVYYLPGGQATAQAGAAHLVDYVDFFESTLGDYLYGDQVASVSVVWGPGQYGGMEHHPLWHISSTAMGDRNTHAHEAAHGWFGNGIRLRCWEDFVLSEGLASYLAARAIGAAEGAAEEDAEWAAYQTRLQQAVTFGDTLAWPDAPCNTIDILNHPVWSSIPYMKGAFFMREVEALVGRAELDAALAAFYAAHAGQAAGMQDLIDTIETETGADLSALVAAWLRGMGIPQ